MAGKDTSTIVLFDVDGTLTVPRKVHACEQPAFQNLPASCAASASGRTAGTTFLVVSGGKALVSGIRLRSATLGRRLARHTCGARVGSRSSVNPRAARGAFVASPRHRVQHMIRVVFQGGELVPAGVVDSWRGRVWVVKDGGRQTPTACVGCTRDPTPPPPPPIPSCAETKLSCVIQ